MGKPIPKSIAHCVIGQIIWKQVYQYHSSMNIVVVGPPGTGKSELTCQLLDLLDPRYNPWEDMAFTDAGFKAIVAKERPAGRASQLEEGGLAVGARNWQSEANKETSALFQIMRHNRGINIVNVPLTAMIDLHVRSVAHMKIVCEGHTDHHSYGRVYLLQADFRTDSGRIFTKIPRFVSKTGQYYKVYSWKALLPRKEIRDIYLERSLKFKKDVEKELARLAEEREDGEGQEERERKQLDELIDLAKVALETGAMSWHKRTGLKADVLKYKYKINTRQARALKNILEDEIKTGSIDPGSAV